MDLDDQTDEALCGLWNVGEQFLLAATAQNLKRLVRFMTNQKHRLLAAAYSKSTLGNTVAHSM